VLMADVKVKEKSEVNNQTSAETRGINLTRFLVHSEVCSRVVHLFLHMQRKHALNTTVGN
jgi:hypothetical protein